MRFLLFILSIFSSRLFILNINSLPTVKSVTNLSPVNKFPLSSISPRDDSLLETFSFPSSQSLKQNIILQPWKDSTHLNSKRNQIFMRNREEPRKYSVFSPTHLIKKPRRKRYPIHLDPFTREPHFWIQTGECPLTPDGTREFFCPTPNESGFWACIDDYQLCDGVKSCPNSEDENPDLCLFYKAVESQLKLIANGVYNNVQEDFDGKLRAT